MLEQWPRTRMPLNPGPGIRACVTNVTNLAMSICIGNVEASSPLHLTRSKSGRRSGSFKTHRERRSGSFKTHTSQKLRNKEWIEQQALMNIDADLIS
jgi:hypothetical protein